MSINASQENDISPRTMIRLDFAYTSIETETF